MKINIIPGIRPDKKDKHGLAPVYIYLYEGSTLLSKKSIGHKVPPALWNKEQKKVEKKFPNAALINSVIARQIEELRTKILLQEMETGEVNLPALLHKEKAKDMCFFEFAEKQIKEKNYAPETRRAYNVYLDKIKAFKPSLKLAEVNYKFLQSYESYLRDTLHNSGNTLWGNFKFINTMCNDAIKLNCLKTNPFKEYSRPKYKNPKKDFLTLQEVDKIENFLSENKGEALMIAGKYFLFMAKTGLRFSDAIRINETHILNNERIVIETQKTKQDANIFLNDKLKDLTRFILDNKLPFGQTEFNRKLKIIAAYCGINKKISSHTARHSFGASLVALGVIPKIAQGLLAHGSAASTQIYYHLDNPLLDEAMKKFDK